jgi:hypothetical protein
MFYKEKVQKEFNGQKLTYIPISVSQLYHFYNFFGKGMLINKKGQTYVEDLSFQQMQEMALKYVEENTTKKEEEKLGEFMVWLLSGNVAQYLYPLIYECFPEITNISELTDESLFEIMNFLMLEFATIINTNPEKE